MHKLLALFLITACGTDVRDTGDTGVTDDGLGYVPLVMQDYSLEPSTETYLCVRQTVAEETWIKAIRPVAPAGTHHAVLMVGPADGPDGTTACASSLTKPAIYASGVGTEALEMPEGVAIHIKPGDQLLLNLHLFNAGSDPLDGTAGIEIIETDAVDAQHQAGVVLTGKAQGLTIPPGTSTQTGTCTTPAGVTVFAVAPHMHTRGIHMKVSYDERVLLDEDYDFDQQRFHELAPAMSTLAGHKLMVECSYFNETSGEIYFGESTTEEMCYALTFVYPAPAVDSCTR